VAGVARDAAVSQGGGGCVHWPWHEPGPRLGKCAILGYNVTDTLASVLALRYGPLNYSTAACCVPDRLEYFGTDGLGSVRQLYDSAGHIVANRRYEPFGSLLSASGTGTSSYDYAGEQRDASTGLLYLRARYLDTDLGRFTQVDPSGWEANPYLYAATIGNPVTCTDPTGQFTNRALMAYLQRTYEKWYGPGWVDYWECWTQDPEWIELLHKAVGGDVLFRAHKVPMEPMLQFYRFEGEGHDLVTGMTELHEPARDARPLYGGLSFNLDELYRTSRGVGVMHFTGADVGPSSGPRRWPVICHRS
jgi:RHS repeat-associated protein